MQLILTPDVAEEIARQLLPSIGPAIRKVLISESYPDTLVDKKTLAKQLGISPNTLNELIQMSGFPKAIKSKYSRKAVDKWLEEVSK